jgi:hypothetical protein
MDTSPESLDAVDAYLMGLLGAAPPAAAAVPGAQVETCVVCHKRAGSKHQELFNAWKNGL